MAENQKGILYVVALPIGNLKDITLRALEVLKEVDLVLTEDTRSFKKLLNFYQLPKKELLSFYKEVEAQKEEKVITLLKEGKKIALCSEAGTPLISDPGAKLIKRAHLEGIKVEPVPGPSSLTAALSASGFDLSRGFIFFGFLPKKEKEIEEKLEVLPRELPLVIFIPPHRFTKTIKILRKILGERTAFLARELTKIHEELIWTKLSELEKKESPKGEITLIIEGVEVKPESEKPSEKELLEEFKELTKRGLKLKEIAKLLSKKYGLSAKELYQRFKDFKD